MHKYLFLFLVFSNGLIHAQKLRKEDKQLVANLQQHVTYLASDKLEGRRTGTQGEKLASEYISEQFRLAGLQPKGSNGYFQPFEINEGRQINPSTHLMIDGKILSLHKDFFPLSFSANTSLEALPSIALQESKMPWFINLKELLEQNFANPHFDVTDAVKKKAMEMESKGASAVFIYNTSELEDKLVFNGKEHVQLLNIPVVYITKEAARKYFGDETATLDIKLKTDIEPRTRTGRNVIGYIDNRAPTTVVIGAHYDHLGYGEEGNSMLRNSPLQIHNGADDNASGTAALIELARLLKNSKEFSGANLKQNNYLFIAFSGEELGLYGSKYFTEHPPVDLASVNYMINMDMIGRINDSSRMVIIGGYGTSPSWGNFYALKGKDKLYTGNLQFKYDSSGTGPSDHTSFYRKDIPVLFFFSGLHSDYHKPTDDYDKINYLGEMQIIKHIYSLIEAQDKQKNRLAFTKTRETQTTTSARFSVSLGITPDYTFSGAGVRVDGVSENRPAQKAGLKTGDVITALGDYSVSSVESYMQALSKFKKGDKTVVHYNRTNEKLSAAIEF
ncbi:MAG: M28 family peptidase [Chitinophagaceae bacterium]